MNYSKLLFLVVFLVTVNISVLIYKKNIPELKFVGIDFWNHKQDTLHIMVDSKTNEVYLQNADGTDSHKWIRKENGKVVLLGEELPIEGN